MALIKRGAGQTRLDATRSRTTGCGADDATVGFSDQAIPLCCQTLDLLRAKVVHERL